MTPSYWILIAMLMALIFAVVLLALNATRMSRDLRRLQYRTDEHIALIRAQQEILEDLAGLKGKLPPFDPQDRRRVDRCRRRMRIIAGGQG